MPLTHLAMEFGAQGPAYNCLTACAASTQAIGEATEILRRGDADVMLAGGAERPISEIGIAGFNACKALSTKRSDAPETASRPYDKDRDGFVMGEGAGVVVLEEYEHALARGAHLSGVKLWEKSIVDRYLQFRMGTHPEDEKRD